MFGALQAAITTGFQDCTVLTIAHRINTIVDTSDRIMVFDAGRLVEFASPAELMARDGSAFRGMVESSTM